MFPSVSASMAIEVGSGNLQDVWMGGRHQLGTLRFDATRECHSCFSKSASQVACAELELLAWCGNKISSERARSC